MQPDVAAGFTQNDVAPADPHTISPAPITEAAEIALAPVGKVKCVARHFNIETAFILFIFLRSNVRYLTNVLER
jgi:hypothetical protein